MAWAPSVKYEHSPIHKAIILKDYTGLKSIIQALPKLRDPSEIQIESISIEEEAKADAISKVIDRRDVPNRDTPLHLAVKFGDETAVEILMQAGVDCTLHNEQGWSALQEAVCLKKEWIVKIIVTHYLPLVWVKWCRRILLFTGTMRRMRNFYMEIRFNFESSVIPFISRIAPSDTYRIWKIGANLRADYTFSGFDGLKIKRADKSALFLGDGLENGIFCPGSLCLVSHKKKEVVNVFSDGYSELDIQQEITSTLSTNVTRTGIDVTQAILLPQMTWRKHEKTEMVGPWKAKVYDMHNVEAGLKSRRVLGAPQPDSDYYEEKDQNEAVIKLENSDSNNESYYDTRDFIIEDNNEMNDRTNSINVENKKKKRGWLNFSKKRDDKPQNSQFLKDKVSDLLQKTLSTSDEKEYKKGLKPVLWLSSDFPLKMEEVIPVFDILANKIKAIRRLKELFTTKLPKGTFPVKVAIPLVPTIRVMVTFIKFEELKPLSTLNACAGESQGSTSSRFQSRTESCEDPFAVFSDYSWISEEEKKLRKSYIKSART